MAITKTNIVMIIWLHILQQTLI